MDDLALFFLVLCFFHASEFGLAAWFNREELSRDSWLLSRAYCLAMSLAVAEHLAESALLGLGGKGSRWPALAGWARAAGLALVLAGEALRKSAIVTARASFTQSIKHRRRPDHRLVTSGVYRFCRHPGYVGWFAWAVGTQLLLRNPLCVCIFAAWAWKFFSERIPYEEHLLLGMFGSEYAAYARRTPVWIPFVDSPVPFSLEGKAEDETF